MKPFLPLFGLWAAMSVGKDIIMNRGMIRNGIWGNMNGRLFYPANSVYTTPIYLTSTVIVKDVTGILDAEVVPFDLNRADPEHKHALSTQTVSWMARHGTLDKHQKMTDHEFRQHYPGYTEVKYFVGVLTVLAFLC